MRLASEFFQSLGRGLDLAFRDQTQDLANSPCLRRTKRINYSGPTTLVTFSDCGYCTECRRGPSAKTIDPIVSIIPVALKTRTAFKWHLICAHGMEIQNWNDTFTDAGEARAEAFSFLKQHRELINLWVLQNRAEQQAAKASTEQLLMLTRKE